METRIRGSYAAQSVIAGGANGARLLKYLLINTLIYDGVRRVK